MPNPATGLGANVSLGLQNFTWALYLCAASSAGALPNAKLLGLEPAAPWVRQGRLKADEFKWNIGAPSFLEGRAGFTQALKYYVVNKAELPKLTIVLDESDPEVLTRIRGNAAGSATSLSSGAYTGYSFIYKAGVVYNCKMLLVGSDLTGGVYERQIYAGNTYATFMQVQDPMAESEQIDAVMANDSNGQAYAIQNWT